jgi:hypothetical protein
MSLADEMMAECLASGQSSRRVATELIEPLRVDLRQAARDAGVKVRTATLDGSLVAIARVDAAIWNDDAATMKKKLGLSAASG